MSSNDSEFDVGNHSDDESELGDDTQDLDSIVGSDEETEVVYTNEIKEMLTVYKRKVRVKVSLGIKADILRLVRKLVIPHEKFVSEGSAIGSFERPNFTNKKSWYYIVLHKAGYNDHSHRAMAKVWVTYQKDVAEAFSNHRSNATSRMKRAFLASK